MVRTPHHIFFRDPRTPSYLPGPPLTPLTGEDRKLPSKIEGVARSDGGV